jgi:hypothetical protein
MRLCKVLDLCLHNVLCLEVSTLFEKKVLRRVFGPKRDGIIGG